MAQSIVNTTVIKIPGITSGITCIEVGKGQWCFNTPGEAWKFDERVEPPHSNFALYCGGAYQYQLRVETLRDAVLYAIGFSYGYKNGYRHGQEDIKGVNDMVAQATQLAKQKNTLGGQPREEKG